MIKNLITKILTKNILIILAVGLFLFGVYKYIDYRLGFFSEEIKVKNAKIESMDKEFKKGIKDLQDLLLSTASGLASVLDQEQQKNNSLKEEFENITDTVDTLEKLSTTDPELLKKYSKVYFLNEHYVPISLSNISEKYRNSKSTNFQIHSDVLSYLKDLIDDANQDGVLALQALSVYRSFATQSILKANYKVTYGAGTANSFSADQGYSEHQLGTALDFTTEKTGALEGFDKTLEYKWLLENAYKYGFIISYPAGNTYYKFEPWHWRFVGIALAERLHDDDMNFYDMDQRVIDSYLADIFD
jgi:LAS superfamily LD-carboxypeptidase LdcB